jgi:hypothetical protein
MKRDTLLFLILVAAVPQVPTGCAALDTYQGAVGSWQNTPVVPEQATAAPGYRQPQPGYWLQKLADQVRTATIPDYRLTIEASGAYTVVICGCTFRGQLEVTSIFGDGLKVRTDGGPLEGEARVRLLSDNRLLLESGGTEVTLHRCR